MRAIGKRPARVGKDDNPREAQEATRASSDQVREGIIHGLFTGQFVPGQKLIEADLIEAFGSSRTYVREALLRLEGDGVVESHQFRGAYIRAFSAEQARDIDLTFAALVALAARQAAERIAQSGRRRDLLKALDELKDFNGTGDLFDYATARERFYRVIIAISGNEEIERICPIMQTHIVRMQMRRPYGQAEHLARLAHYQAIFDAIMTRDPIAAEHAVWASIENLTRTYSGPVGGGVVPDNTAD